MSPQKRSPSNFKKFLFVSFLLVGCGAMPTKPVVTLCIIDYAQMQGSCANTDGSKINHASELTYMTMARRLLAGNRIPLSQMDKNICFAPSEWEKVQNYIDQLENAMKNKE